MNKSTLTRTPARAKTMRAKTMRTSMGLAVATLVALSVAGCRPDEPGTQVAGWNLLDPSQRHPILVAREPATVKVHVSRGTYGLSPSQRADVSAFLAKYRATDAGNSKLVIAVPSGSPNEVAAMQVVAEIRHLMSEFGFDPSNIHVQAYHGERNPQPPVRISYLRYVAQGPECGDWPTNLANEPANVAYPNFGCATQRNFAASVANPADLLGPRGETPRPGDRRDSAWAKYKKGESTASEKKQDERVSTRQQQ